MQYAIKNCKDILPEIFSITFLWKKYKDWLSHLSTYVYTILIEIEKSFAKRFINFHPFHAIGPFLYFPKTCFQGV